MYHSSTVYAEVHSTFTSQYTNLKKASGVVNLTSESFCHQNNVVRPPATHQHWHHHWAGEAVTCADATAASVLQCTHLSSQQLAALNHLQLRWLTLEKTHTHTYMHGPYTFTNANKPNQMCANTNVHTQAETHSRAQVRVSLHSVAKYMSTSSEGREKKTP